MRLQALVLALSTVACTLQQREDEDVVAKRLQRQTACTILGETRIGSPRVYFSPFDPVEDQVLCALDSAQREVVAAQYNIRSERVLQKLIALKHRGVDVRVAVDASNAANAWNTGDDRLEREGIKLVRFKPTAQNAIMHLKVSVIDGAFAMSGSFNWNETAAAGNDENMIAFRDPEIVSRYRNQVLEVLGERPRTVEPARANSWAMLSFAPETQVDRPIVGAIDAARTSVDVAMFTFTMQSIADALVRAQHRGVRVRVIVEDKQDEYSTADEKIAASGALLIRAANKTGPHSAMHQKYAVIDGTRVITGATNWTFSGTRSNEEDLLILDAPAVADVYARNFRDLLNVYARIDDGSMQAASAPILFTTHQPATEYGDFVVVTGGDPALGSWDPWKGIPMVGDMFPHWTARARLPAGANVEWKLVTIRRSGAVEWEPGENRKLTVPGSGRAVVIGGAFGDTTNTATPADR